MNQFIASRRVATGKTVGPATIEVQDGKIKAIHSYAFSDTKGISKLDFGDCLVMPGMVDAHVHINEPGRTDWEGFETATLAAAAGGVTTLIDMPLNSSPVTTTQEAFAAKLAATKNQLHVDCGFWGGVVPDNLDKIGGLVKAGVLGFKSFMINSGIDEFMHTSGNDLRNAFKTLADHDLPYLLHAETSDGLSIPQLAIGRSFQAHVKSRPKIMENKAIATLINLCEEFGVRTHIVHLSSDEALDMINEAKQKGLPLTVETCPHYLFFTCENVPDGDPLYKCTPPIRDRETRNNLMQALKDGLIDTIGSDHSPAPASVKAMDTGDIGKAWGGISSLQLTLHVMLKLAEEFGLDDQLLVNALCSAPADMAGLREKKGRLELGYDADIVVVDTGKDYTPAAKNYHFKHKHSPYTGQKLKGEIKLVLLRGQQICQNGIPSTQHHGNTIIHAR